MRTWQLWTQDEILKIITDFEPLLASWNKNTDQAQVRLQTYLNQLTIQLKPFLVDQNNLFLHLDVDVHQPKHLLHQRDLENYLKPLFGRRWLNVSHFVFVSARKYVGGGSRLLLGIARPLTDSTTLEGWKHFSCAAGSGTQERQWKVNLRAALATSHSPLPPMHSVEVQLAWRCSPKRNWTELWKPTGDSMGPILGEPNPRNPFDPNDGRIISLGLHLNSNPTSGHKVDVGMWWRSADK
jgi:hypothetical protein